MCALYSALGGISYAMYLDFSNCASSTSSSCFAGSTEKDTVATSLWYQARASSAMFFMMFICYILQAACFTSLSDKLTGGGGGGGGSGMELANPKV